MTRNIIRFIMTLAVAAVAIISPSALAAAEKYTVVIDAGHGGKDTGAVDNGLKEKDINLGVALKLGEMIKKQLKDVKVVYTRDNDTYLTLQERADKANKSKGNLFISIHTNSVDMSNKNRTTIAGASVYVLGLHKDQDNMGIARRENAVIELEKDYKQKYSGFDPNSDESYIIFEMAQKKNLARSFRFADNAQKQMVSKAGRRDRGVHQAGFWVLWATSMPAVLVELDFICNPNSAKYMGSEIGQTQLAGALLEAVKNYFSNSAASRVTEVPSEEAMRIAYESSDQAVAATPVHDTRRRVSAPAENGSRNRTSTARRRRNDSSKAASEARDVSIDSIPVRPVSRPLRISEEEDALKVDKPEAEMTKAELKAKKKAESEAKKKAEAESRRQAREKTKTHKGKVARLKTVYKIQILTSAELLKQSDPRFCGLKPISYYRENNLYKYTYGETTSEEEIQKTLKEVRKKIPDAFVIKSIS